MKAYRALLNAFEFVIVWAEGFAQAAAAFHGSYPGHRFVAHRQPWEDGRMPNGSIRQQRRLRPLADNWR